ncbi:MAG: hypothetical protein OXJ52_08605 [Oligoflexia bacterium]|nr:hypothetical protein [Oligoflexia bacterium]
MKIVVLLALLTSLSSYGDNSAPVSQPELLEDSVSTQELLSDTKTESSLLNSSSLLSIKGAVFIVRSVKFLAQEKFKPDPESKTLGLIALEYQDSWQKKEQLKWITSVGVLFAKSSGRRLIFPVDTGLRYVFQSKPVTLSFKIGLVDAWGWTELVPLGPFITLLYGSKLDLSLGWKFSNQIHTELTAGTIGLAQYVGWSVSYPLEW